MTSDKVAALLRRAGLQEGEIITRENSEILVSAFTLAQADALGACRAVADSYGGPPPVAAGPYEERAARRAAALVCLVAVNTALEK